MTDYERGQQDFIAANKKDWDFLTLNFNLDWVQILYNTGTFTTDLLGKMPLGSDSLKNITKTIISTDHDTYNEYSLGKASIALALYARFYAKVLDSWVNKVSKSSSLKNAGLFILPRGCTIKIDQTKYNEVFIRWTNNICSKDVGSLAPYIQLSTWAKLDWPTLLQYSLQQNALDYDSIIDTKESIICEVNGNLIGDINRSYKPLPLSLRELTVQELWNMLSDTISMEPIEE